MRLKLNQEVLDETLRRLNIRRPVVIEHLKSFDHIPSNGLTTGAYEGMNENKHHISIANSLSPRNASEVLLHELVHVRQAEEHGVYAPMFPYVYTAETLEKCVKAGCYCNRPYCPTGYRFNKFEQDARAQVARAQARDKVPELYHPVSKRRSFRSLLS